MIHISHAFFQWRKVSLIGILSAFLLVLSACGVGASSTTTGSNPGSTSTPGTSPTATVTTNKGYTSLHGCPGNAVVSTAPKQANVTIQNKDINSTVTAHVGDIIEIRLPFGQKWSGPLLVPANLQQQQPVGYAFPSGNVCVWRFIAQGVGIAHLEFHSQAICAMGQMCPMFIVVDPFTIDVK